MNSHDKVDHLVRLSLAFALKPRLGPHDRRRRRIAGASTGTADEQVTRNRQRAGCRAGHRAGAPGADGVSLEFRRYRDAARPRRGAGGRQPLLLLLRRALHRGLPHRHRHSGIHPQDHHRQCEGGRGHHPGAEHLRRRLRPGLPDRDPLRARLRAHDGRGQAGQYRRAAALCHGSFLRIGRRAFPACPRHGPAGRHRRRRAGRPRLRPSPGPAGP